jgi:uracil permease
MAIFEKYQDDLTAGKKTALGIQHALTMYGATVLVPILTGLDISVALFMAGLCTLFFHLVTVGKIPVFLGSSFAFIVPITAVAEKYGLPYAQGGIVIAGIVYLILALLFGLFGAQKIISFFPPIVTGPIIIIIGLTLAPVAVGRASENWLLAFVSFAVVAAVAFFTRGFIRILPVLCGLFGGYLAALITGNVDFTPIREAKWIGVPNFTIAKFNLDAILLIAPVVIVTVVEHIGNVLAISSVTGKDFIKSPGLRRTLMGNGIATSLSAFFGGPANTTYSEDTGIMAITRQYNPVIMRIAACFAIVLAVTPKFGAVIRTIPDAVIGGGISIVLFGMIVSVGIRTLTENGIDFKKTRNMFIVAVTLVLGLGIPVVFPAGGVPITINSSYEVLRISPDSVRMPVIVNSSYTYHLSSMFIAAIAGIILNKVLPDKD